MSIPTTPNLRFVAVKQLREDHFANVAACAARLERAIGQLKLPRFQERVFGELINTITNLVEEIK